MNRLAAIALVCLLQAIFAPGEKSCYAFRPQAVRLLEAELVILGELTEIQEEENRIIGKISVEMVLKGATDKQTVIAEWRKKVSPFSLTESPPDSLEADKRGIWFLDRDNDSKRLRGLGPRPDANAEQTDEIQQELATLAELPWSEPVGGLAMGLIVDVRDLEGEEVWNEGKLIAAQVAVAVFPVAKNTLNQDLLVAESEADHPFVATWSRPGSWDLKAKLYSVPKRENGENTADDLQRIRPNQIRQIGHGFVFPPLVDDGQYTLQINFSSQRDKSDQSSQVWQGTIELPTFKLELPLEEIDDDEQPGNTDAQKKIRPDRS
jgi:hypothetical protein